ncbi:hypothetical protein [Streptomyces sp. NPDC096132]|uniref:hypothetical protein n=1 Tax=Streptomyces sp. NPDC096132 TaxID=3366075 RepID=UPI00382BC51F
MDGAVAYGLTGEDGHKRVRRLFGRMLPLTRPLGMVARMAADQHAAAWKRHVAGSGPPRDRPGPAGAGCGWARLRLAPEPLKARPARVRPAGGERGNERHPVSGAAAGRRGRPPASKRRPPVVSG